MSDEKIAGDVADSAAEAEEYKQLANDLKDQGNAAFQRGDIEEAIRLFTQAIDLDPDNYVLYSNRSAAYMKADSKSKALHDAEKCVELAPHWAKGYNRLGVAQQSLKRFDAATDSFKKGIELDRNNQALWAALKACEEADKADKKERFRLAELERQAEEERLKKRNEIREEILREKQEDMLNDFFSDIHTAAAEPSPSTGDNGTAADASAGAQSSSEPPAASEDDLLASFFTEVTAAKKDPENVPVTTQPNEEQDSPEEVLTEKYAQQDLGNGRDQCARLLAKHCEWRNLNPYYVLQLDTDANEEDIKFRYKKLSLKVHPDRLRDIENAREAFEHVKDAYARLMDPAQRKTLCMHIENVTTELLKERRKAIAKNPSAEASLPPYEEERQRRLMKHFAEMEMMRRKSDQNRRAYSAREKMQESKEEEELGRQEEFEKNWAEDGRREKRVFQWRDFKDVPEGKRVKASNFKEEQRDEKKYGSVQLESWKKSWK